MTENEFNFLKILCETEIRLIKEYNRLFSSAGEPQLKSDLQIICASHKNHLASLIELMENDK